MSKDKEKKLNNNKIDIDNENISGGCKRDHMGNKHGHPQGFGRGHRGGYWIYVPEGHGMVPPPPPNFDKNNPIAPMPEQNSVIPQSSDTNSTPESSTPAQ